MPFRQIQPPQLSLFCTLSQSKKITNIDYCPNLICQTESAQFTDISYVLFIPGQGQLSLLTLEQGCLLSKNNVEVMYAYTYKITAIAMITMGANREGFRLSKGVYALIGFDDGTFSLYIVMESGNHPLVQVFRMRPQLTRKEPVINFLVYKTNLIVVTAFNVIVYDKLFEKESSNSSQPRKFEHCKQIPIKININSYKLNSQLDHRNGRIYIYNEYQGAVCLDLQSMHEQKKVQDCIKAIKLCPHLTPKSQEIVILGGSDNTIKFIDYKTNVIEKWVGIKNYAVAMEEDQASGILWVGDLEGSITCFQFVKGKDDQKEGKDKRDNFVMHQNKIQLNYKVSEHGIKKLIVHQNLLVLFDCNHNIFLYDIIKDNISTGRSYEPDQN